MAKTSGPSEAVGRGYVRQIVLPVREDLYEVVKEAEPQTFFLFLDAEAIFDARTLEPLTTLDKDVVLPVDIESYGYEFSERAYRYFEGQFEDVRKANPIGALLISAAALRASITGSTGLVERISKDDFSFRTLLDVVLDSGAEVALADIFPIKASGGVSTRAFHLRRASRSNDGFFSTVAVRPVSRQLSGLLARTRISPNLVTAVSLATSLLASVLFAIAVRPMSLLAVALMYASLVLDCVDGELARLTDRGSRFGAWLDGFTDRIKEHLLIVGLAVGSYRAGNPAWLIATLAILAITLRHLSHFAFIETVLKDFIPKDSLQRGRIFDRPGVGSLHWRQWVSRVLHAPVSERWLAIAFGVLVFNQATALWIYFVYVSLSLALVTIGWTRRTFAMTGDLSGGAKSRILQLAGGRIPMRVARKPVAWYAVPLTMVLESASVILPIFVLDEDHHWLPLIVMVVVSWLRYEDMYAGFDSSPPLRLGTWASRMVLWLLASGIAIFGFENAAVWWLSGWALTLTVLMLINAVSTGQRIHKLYQTN